MVDDLFFAKWISKPRHRGRDVRGPLFKSVETGQRLVDRLIEPPINLTEDEAMKRLSGLFVGPDEQDKPAPSSR